MEKIENIESIPVFKAENPYDPSKPFTACPESADITCEGSDAPELTP